MCLTYIGLDMASIGQVVVGVAVSAAYADTAERGLAAARLNDPSVTGSCST